LLLRRPKAWNAANFGQLVEKFVERGLGDDDATVLVGPVVLADDQLADRIPIDCGPRLLFKDDGVGVAPVKIFRSLWRGRW